MAIEDGNIVQVRFKGVCFLQEILLIQTYRCVGNFPGPSSYTTDLTTIINSINTAGAYDIVTSYMLCLPPQYSLTDVIAQVIYPTRSVAIDVISVTPGTNANAATAANDSSSLIFQTQKATPKKLKSGHGQTSVRKIGPIGDGMRTGGNLTILAKAALVNLGNKLLASLTYPVGGPTVATLVPTIFHRKDNTYDDLSNFYIGDTARVHRRRTVGIGS
jgi:hypothetical protein